MNETIKQLQNHKSIRKYTNEPIDQAIIDSILKATQQAPSWINGQQMTIIRVQTKKSDKRCSSLLATKHMSGQRLNFGYFALIFTALHKRVLLKTNHSPLQTTSIHF